jgi:hypothetical protein
VAEQAGSAHTVRDPHTPRSGCAYTPTCATTIKTDEPPFTPAPASVSITSRLTHAAQYEHIAATDPGPIFEDMTALTLTLQAPTAPLPLPARAPADVRARDAVLDVVIPVSPSPDNASTDRTLPSPKN